MGLIFRLAYRNLFRNTRRSVLTALLVGCSLAALILTDGLIIGMLKVMVDSATHTFAGEGQVHRKGFMESLDVDLYISDSDSLELTLLQDPQVSGFSSRTMAGGMISSPDNMSGGLIYGIDGQRESTVSRLKEAMVQGEYISGGPNEILLGEDLADLLEAELGDRLVITVAQSGGGELSQGLFRLSGIFRFGMRELDNNLAFISLNRSRELLGMSNGAHEVAIKFIDQDIPNQEGLPLFDALAGDSNEAQGWREFMPQINAMIEMVDYSTLIVGIVLFLLASLGVINSMFMSIYERIYEFGVAKAIGTRPRQLVQLILMEAFVLGVFSIIFGLILGGSATWYWSIYGLPFGEYEMSGISLVEPIKSVITWQQFIYFPIYVLLLIMVASLYPARFAARIVPSEALQRTL